MSQAAEFFKTEAAKREALADQERQLAQVRDDRAQALGQAVKVLIAYMDGKTTKTEVVNQLTSIRTPDVANVVKAIEKLDERVGQLDLSPLQNGLQALLGELEKLPKQFPTPPEPLSSVSVSNLDQLDRRFASVETAIKGLKLTAEAPKVDVNVPETTINVEKPDLAPLQDSMLQMLQAIQEIEIPVQPPTDLSTVEKRLDESNKTLKKLLEKPVGGGGGGGSVPFEDSTGKPAHVRLNADGSLPVTNPDGSYIGGASTPSAVVAFLTTVTTAGTRVQLAAHSTQGFILEAPSTNTGLIYVGGSNVSSTVFGAELQPGQSASVAVNNTNLIYIDASVNGDKCAVLGS